MSISNSSRDFKTTVYGKYFLLDRIAVGGMAEVFKAKTFGVRGFERLLVIKRILPHLSKDEDFVEMFIDEAKISVELSHANIVQVTDLGKIGDNYFIAMEYIDGKDLRAILKKSQSLNKSLTIEQAAFVVIEVCKGLDYAHRKKSSVTNKPLDIIHRDISPQNIMISYEGEVKVVDFGIAKTASKLNQTQAGVLKGKFGYMSPEQATGLEVDQRTDVFSTGIILFELLTGRRLFLGDTDFETLEKIKECKIPPPSLFNKDVPEELDRITLKALDKDLIKRYANVKEIQVDLTRYFYSAFPDFTASNLSSFLKKLFRDEIKTERSKLKQSLASLPIEGLIDSELAAHSNEQVVDSHGSGKGTGQSTILSQNDRLDGFDDVRDNRTIPSKKGNLYEKTVGRLFGHHELEGDKQGFFSSNKYLFIGIFMLLAFAGIFIWMNQDKSGNGTKPTPTVTATPEIATKEFNIISEPTKAKIYVDGEYKGETPKTLSLQLDKSIIIKLVKEGFEPKSAKLLLSQKDAKDQSFKLSAAGPKIAVLNVTSSPSGASIYVDGKATGLTTPSKIKNLYAGEEYRIELRLNGYTTNASNIRLKDGKENQVNFTLALKPIALKVITNPRGAKVALHGFREQTSPATFSSGLKKGKTYKLRVYKNGYKAATRNVKITGSKTEWVTLQKIQAAFGYISINAVPYAQIFLDGEIIGYTPIKNRKVSTGKHKIVFKHPNAKDKVETIIVSRNKEKVVIVRMDVTE